MTPHAAWYVARATGIVAWALLSASVMWGLLLSSRLVRGRGVPKWLLDLHRFLGGLSVAFLGVHVAALVADNYVPFGPAAILVPFAGEWKPAAVASGVVAMYLLVAIEVTSLMMRRLPRRWWRRVHASSFVSFALATAHGLQAGTDANNWAMFGAYAGATAAVVFLAVFRVSHDATDR